MELNSMIDTDLIVNELPSTGLVLQPQIENAGE